MKLKDTWNQIRVKTKETIKSLLIFSGFMEILFILSYIYTLPGVLNEWFLIQLVLFSYFIFFAMIFVFTLALVTLGVYAKKKNRIAVGILITFLVIYLLTLAKGFLAVILELYSENLGIDKGTYLSSVISILSLVVAIGMPLYLTEKNRKRAEEVAKENQKYNEEMIFENRIHSEKLIIDQLRLNSTPVIRYSCGSFVFISAGGSNESFFSYKRLEKFKKEIDQAYIKINIENVTDRIAREVYCVIPKDVHIGQSKQTIVITQSPFKNGEAKDLKIDAKRYLEWMQKEKVNEVELDVIIIIKDVFLNESRENINVYLTITEKSNVKVDYIGVSKA